MFNIKEVLEGVLALCDEDGNLPDNGEFSGMAVAENVRALLAEISAKSFLGIVSAKMPDGKRKFFWQGHATQKEAEKWATDLQRRHDDVSWLILNAEHAAVASSKK